MLAPTSFLRLNLFLFFLLKYTYLFSKSVQSFCFTHFTSIILMSFPFSWVFQLFFLVFPFLSLCLAFAMLPILVFSLTFRQFHINFP